MILVRYADDLVAGFEHEDDARRFIDGMRERFEAFSQSLHSDKTRLIEFGRHAAVDRKKRGVSRTETFVFLGLTFICGKISPRILPTSAEDPARPHAGEAPGNQGGAAAANAPDYSSSGPLAEAGRYRPLRLLCGTHE
jgi:hypothetical protein